MHGVGENEREQDKKQFRQFRGRKHFVVGELDRVVGGGRDGASEEHESLHIYRNRRRRFCIACDFGHAFSQVGMHLKL